MVTGRPIDATQSGPCITGIIDIREQPELNGGMVIEDGTAPGGFSKFLPQFLAAAGKLLGRDTDRGVSDFLKEKLRVWTSLILGAYHGAVRNTQVYLVMTHDDGAGRMRLEDDRLRIDWLTSVPNRSSPRWTGG